MRLRRVDEATATILAVTGRLDGSMTEGLHTMLLEVIAEAPPRLVLDFGGLEYVSSAGLRILLMAAKQVRNTATTLVLCALRPNVMEVFEISGLATVFSIAPGREAAMTHGR